MTTYQWIALVLLLGWPVTGIALGIVMAGRGYSGFGWGVIGAFPEEEEHARRALDDAHGTLRLQGAAQGVDPGRVVLHGKPADALRAYAAEEGYDAIAAGCHGHGASKAVLGSTADALTRHSEVPLIVSHGHGTRHEGSVAGRKRASVS